MNVAIDFVYLFILALFNAIVIFGVNRASYFEYCHPEDTSEDCDCDRVDRSSKMVLYRFRLWSLQSLGEYWSKPLFTCPPCMASVHSLYVYWLVMPFTTGCLLFYPLYILFLSGLVALIQSLTGYGK